MTEEVKDQQSNDELELESLKQRANQMGLKYHHKTGLTKMRTLVNSALQADKEQADPTPTPTTPDTKQAATAPTAGPLSPTEELKRSMVSTPVKPIEELTPKEAASRLVRIRVNCMNPDKTEYEGQIFSVSNRHFGFKKYVPFNNDEGWHVPYMIYSHMKERKCQIFKTQKDDRGNKTRVGMLISEFAIELMDPLTPDEMKALAQRQAMANGTQG